MYVSPPIAADPFIYNLLCVFLTISWLRVLQHLAFRASLQWLLSSAPGSQCSTELTGLLTWKNSFEYRVLVFWHALLCIHASIYVLMPFPVWLLQRWTEDEQAEEELPRSRTDSAELWGRCPQVRSALECVFLKREGCVLVTGCVTLTCVISNSSFKKAGIPLHS